MKRTREGPIEPGNPQDGPATFLQGTLNHGRRAVINPGPASLKLPANRTLRERHKNGAIDPERNMSLTEL